MKTLFYFELAFLAIIDLLLLFALTGSLSVRMVELITMVNAVVGPIQLLTAFFMCFWESNWSKHFITYVIITVLTIIAFIEGNILLSGAAIQKTFYLYMMFFCFGLAHYFVLALYDLSRLKITKQFS